MMGVKKQFFADESAKKIKSNRVQEWIHPRLHQYKSKKLLGHVHRIIHDTSVAIFIKHRRQVT